MKASVFPLALVALLTHALASADIYRYETDEGVLAFTDDVKRVPSRYQDSVERIAEASLFEYARVTIVPRGASNSAGWTLPEGESATAPRTEPGRRVRISSNPSTTTLRTEPGRRVRISSNPSTTTLDLPAHTDAPVELERTTEWKWVDGRYVPFAVVKLDGRTVSTTRLR